MLHNFLTHSSPILVAALAIGSLTSQPGAPVSLDAMTAVQLDDDQTRNMSEIDSDSSATLMNDGPFGPPVCPYAWTCDWENWYLTDSACHAACGAGNCYLDHACDRSCLCP